MKKLLVVVLALALVAGVAYAGDQAKKVMEPVTTAVTSTGAAVNNVAQGTVDPAHQGKRVGEPVVTVVKSTGNTVTNVAEGTIETLDVNKNPVVTVTKTTKNVVEDTAKTVTFQKVDKKKPVNPGN